MGSRLTGNQFWTRLQTANRLGEIKGARFEDDTPAKKLRRRAEAVVLPWRFNKHYLPHYFRSAPAAFHVELYRALEYERRTVARAPRGHAKSTVVTFAYPVHQVALAPVLKAWEDGTLEASDPELYAAIHEVMHEELESRLRAVLAAFQEDPDLTTAEAVEAARVAFRRGDIPLHWDPYIQIIAATEDLAEEFTGAILAEFIDNELLRSDWGVVVEDPHQAVGDWESTTGVRVKAFGMRGSIRGGKHRQWRPTLAIVDDPDSEETIGTSAVRERQEKKLTSAVNYGLEPKKSRIFVLGTPVHGDCLVCRLTKPERFKRWKKLRYSCWAAVGVPLWAERWSATDLEAERDEDPDSFAMEMEDLPPSTGKPFEQIHTYSRVQFVHSPFAKVMVLDPALGKTDKSDFQALVQLRGPTPEGWALVDFCELLRIGDPQQLVRHVNGVYDRERPDVAVIETILFAALLETMLSADARLVGLLAGWIRIDTQKESKDLRFRGLAPHVNRGIIRFPDDRTCRPLEHQVLDYPDGKRDGLDALEMGYRYMRTDRRRIGAGEIFHRPRPHAMGLREEDDDVPRRMVDAPRAPRFARGAW